MLVSDSIRTSEFKNFFLKEKCKTVILQIWKVTSDHETRLTAAEENIQGKGKCLARKYD